MTPPQINQVRTPSGVASQKIFWVLRGNIAFPATESTFSHQNELIGEKFQCYFSVLFFIRSSPAKVGASRELCGGSIYVMVAVGLQLGRRSGAVVSPVGAPTGITGSPIKVRAGGFETVG